MTTPRDIPPHVADVLRDSIEITLPTPDDFLKIKETLTRIGIASLRGQTLYQSCHILHKRGKYYIMSFKELFLLDGKAATTAFSDDDRARRNTIARMLEEWGLLTIVNPMTLAAAGMLPPGQVTVLPFREKGQWQLVSKYAIGKKRDIV
jgi:hypothetical protein